MTSSLRPSARAMSATVKKPGLAVSPRSIFLMVAYATPLRAASSCWDRPWRSRVLRRASPRRSPRPRFSAEMGFRPATMRITVALKVYQPSRRRRSAKCQSRHLFALHLHFRDVPRNDRLRYEGSKEEGYTQGLKGFLDARRGRGLQKSRRKTAARASDISLPRVTKRWNGPNCLLRTSRTRQARASAARTRSAVVRAQAAFGNGPTRRSAWSWRARELTIRA
jgi:hypothetical protein